MKELTIKEFLDQSIDFTAESIIKISKKTNKKHSADIYLIDNLLKDLIFVRHNLEKDLFEL